MCVFQEDKQRFLKAFIRGLRKKNIVFEIKFLKMTKESSKSSKVKRATGEKMTMTSQQYNQIIITPQHLEITFNFLTSSSQHHSRITTKEINTLNILSTFFLIITVTPLTHAMTFNHKYDLHETFNIKYLLVSELPGFEIFSKFKFLFKVCKNVTNYKNRIIKVFVPPKRFLTLVSCQTCVRFFLL